MYFLTCVWNPKSYSRNRRDSNHKGLNIFLLFASKFFFSFIFQEQKHVLKPLLYTTMRSSVKHQELGMGFLEFGIPYCKYFLSMKESLRSLFASKCFFLNQHQRAADSGVPGERRKDWVLRFCVRFGMFCLLPSSKCWGWLAFSARKVFHTAHM